MTTATKSTTVVSMLGGQYAAECGPDGKYTLKMLEFFSTHKRGENGVNHEITDEWITEAYKGLVELAPKTLLPVNVFHHGDPQHPEVRQIAYFIPRALKPVFVNGRDRLTIFGDIVGIDSYDFNAIREVKLPFRSAQILSIKHKRFSALSLLKDQVGYYNYPMTTVGSVTFSGAIPDLPVKAESPMMAYRATSADGDSAIALYAFGGNDDKKKKKKTDDKKGGPPKKDKEGGDGEDDEKDGAAPGEEGEEGEDGEVGEDDGASATDAMSTDEKIDKILACVTQLMKDSSPSENDVNGNKSPSQDTGSKKTYAAKKEEAVSDTKADPKTTENSGTAAPVVAPSTTAAPAAPATSTDKAQIENDAKYAALEDAKARLESKLSEKELADKAVSDLEGCGFRLTKSTKAKIVTYAAKGDESLKQFVETYKSVAEKDPPQSAGTEGASTVAVVSQVAGGMPDEVATYAAKNPQDKKGISLRAKLWPEYQEYKAQGGTIPSFDRYVSAELQAMDKRALLGEA